MIFWKDLERIEKYYNSNKKVSIVNFIIQVFLNSGYLLTLMYRVSNLLYKKKIPLIPIIIGQLQRIVIGADISYKAEIGEGILIVHGMGIVIGENVKIGKNLKIMNDVTIGNKLSNYKDDGQPVIGDNIKIGVGARLLGPIKIGNDVVIGANAVVIDDVPDKCIAVGVPAIVKRKKEND
jgi:serine O-acetyltransferase